MIAVSRWSGLWNKDSTWDLSFMPKRQNPSEVLPVEIREKLPSFVSSLGIAATLSKERHLPLSFFLSSSLIFSCSTAKDQPPSLRVSSSHIFPYQNLSGTSTGSVSLAQTNDKLPAEPNTDNKIPGYSINPSTPKADFTSSDLLWAPCHLLSNFWNGIWGQELHCIFWIILHMLNKYE